MRHTFLLAYLSLSITLLTAIDAQAVTIGAGPTQPAAGTDLGTPTNIDLTAPQTLAADTYNVLGFDVRSVTTNATQAVQPFLTVGSPQNHTVVWVGPAFIPGIRGSATFQVDYPAGTEQFTLAAGQTVYAGVDSLGAIVQFAAGGPTDHNSIVSLGPLSVDQVLDNFTNPNLDRTYLFSLTVEKVPEPISLSLLGMSGMMLVRYSRYKRCTR